MIRRLISGFGLAVLLLAAAGSRAEGQDTARVTAVRALTPGQRIRVDLRRAGRDQGRFVAANDTAVTLTRDGVSAALPLADLERLWVRGRATARGALIGGGAGALVGIVYGLLISQVACEPVDGGDCTAAEVALLTGALGGAGGAVIGAGVGYAIPIWRLRFP